MIRINVKKIIQQGAISLAALLIFSSHASSFEEPSAEEAYEIGWNAGIEFCANDLELPPLSTPPMEESQSIEACGKGFAKSVNEDSECVTALYGEHYSLWALFWKAKGEACNCAEAPVDCI